MTSYLKVSTNKLKDFTKLMKPRGKTCIQTINFYLHNFLPSGITRRVKEHHCCFLNINVRQKLNWKNTILFFLMGLYHWSSFSNMNLLAQCHDLREISHIWGTRQSSFVNMGCHLLVIWRKFFPRVWKTDPHVLFCSSTPRGGKQIFIGHFIQK